MSSAASGEFEKRGASGLRTAGSGVSIAPPSRRIGSPGDLIAGRYGLQECLGQGGYGEVWEAADRLAEQPVALKLFHHDSSAPVWIRQEISTLRLLRLPGVVRLLDEGVEGDRPFLVMERVGGTPFPGDTIHIPCAWTEIAPLVMDVLATLSHIHAAGVVHRDLKPENILVNAERRPTILDFGLSFRSQFGDDTSGGHVLGTPFYLAPEQIRSEPVTPQTDLYALGVMLYEVLSGKPPHDVGSFQELTTARLALRPVPLRHLRPDIPAEVSDIVDCLLAIEPEDRPRSAAEVMHRLHGQPIQRPGGRTLPRLGDELPLRRLLDCARQGRAVDVFGPTGSGRSRCLSDAAEMLEQEGKRTIRLTPTDRPLDALEPLLGSMDDRRSEPLVDILADVDRRLRAVLAEGIILLVDDADKLDRFSRDALERCRSAGCVIRIFSGAPRERSPDDPGDAVHLAPLDETALFPLFAGPERFFHLRTDAARMLWGLTEGLPSRIAEEITAWERAGFARWHDTLLVVDREGLDRLAAGLRVHVCSSASGGAAVPSLSPRFETLLVWISAAWPDSRSEWIALAMNEPLWRIEAEIRQLSDVGAVRCLPDGRIEPRAAPSHRWSPEERRMTHRKLADLLAPGSDNCLLHLIGAYADGCTADAIEIAREAARLAGRRAEEGRLGQAVAALVEGLVVVRRAADPSSEAVAGAEASVLALWVEIALFENTPRALDRVLYEICRTEHRTLKVKHLEALVRAALALAAGSERALSMVESVAPFDDPRLERGRHTLRVFGARRISQQRLKTLLAEIASWAHDAGEAHARAALASWMGRLRYQQRRFDEAADLHARAAEEEPWIGARILAMLQSASARMEAFDLENAAEVASRARNLAAAIRHSHYEARAEWLVRTLAYRTGAALEADPDLVDAAAQLGVADLEALVCLTEAAILWRAAFKHGAAELAERARRLWTGMGKRWVAPLARCLSIACGTPASAGEAHTLAEHALQCPEQSLGLQMLGLLSISFPDSRAAWGVGTRERSRAVAREFWHVRMDVLSVEESLAAAGLSTDLTQNA